MENDLIEIVQLVGKDSLSEDQKATLEVAKLIKDEFLQQNAFSEYDYNCPLPKTIGMMKCIVTYYEQCNKILLESQMTEKKISMALIEAVSGSGSEHRLLLAVHGCLPLKGQDADLSQSKQVGHLSSLVLVVGLVAVLVVCLLYTSPSPRD